MQKVVNRSTYANKYAARKLAKQKVLEDRLYQVKDRLEQQQIKDVNRAQYKQHKRVRLESINRGQLAPRYDVGARADQYGTINPGQAKLRRVAERDRVTCPFVVDDRVVLVGARYRDRGRIGKVLEIDKETQSLKIEGVELANFYQEKYMRAMTKVDSPSAISAIPVLFKDVRLVYPLVHPETGALRDVIINDIELRNPTWQEKRAGIEKPIRTIAGLVPPVELPYPEERDPGHSDTASDTLRIEAEERTWVPTLGVPPMPPSVIDELRHKYSVFRTRYDEDFIARKEAAAQRKADKERSLKMAAKTPLDEINLAKRDEWRRISAEAAEGGAWTPLPPDIIQRIASLGLETEQRTGRKLPAQTREQFELIKNGEFEDDPEPDMAVAAVEEFEEDDAFDQDEDAFEEENERIPETIDVEHTTTEKQSEDRARP